MAEKETSLTIAHDQTKQVGESFPTPENVRELPVDLAPNQIPTAKWDELITTENPFLYRGNEAMPVAGSIGGNIGNAPFITGKITTTDATPFSVTLMTFNAGTVCLAQAYVVARRIAGSSGVAGDSGTFIRRAGYKRTSTSTPPTLMTMAQDDFTHRDQSTWDADFVLDLNNLKIQVTGADDNTVEWTYYVNLFLQA